MNLKNKNIAEGMRVTNSKDKLKVISWDKSYSDCLLNYLDSKGNRYVVAQNYELSGTEKDPQISWMNGRYFTANSDDEALEEYLDYLGEVNEYDISESLKKKSIKKSLKEYNKKDGRKYKIYGYSGKKETFVIYSSKRNGVFDYTMTKDYVLENFPNEECDSTDIDDLNYFVKYEGLGELIYGYMAEFNGEDYVDTIECVRNKGNILEVTINLKKEGTFLLKNGWWGERDATKFFGYYTCDGSFDSSWVIDNDGTPKIYLKLYIYSPNNRLLESLKESENTYFIGGENYQGFEVCMIENGKKYYLSKLARNIVDSSWSSDHTYAKHFKLAKAEEIVDILNSELTEKKSLKESAKPINERNVAKFVDELNEWCDDNVHFADLESAKYTREYGKLYDFEWGWDYSYGDKGLIKVWDNEGTLDWFEETRVKDFIVKLAKKYGWYAEPVTNDSDFTFDEL